MPEPPAQHNAVSRGPTPGAPRRFKFKRDSFAFANELLWEYRFDAQTGRTVFARRVPKPAYAHRCFVLTRAARQFLYHAHFDASLAPCDDRTCQMRIRAVASRNPRIPCMPADRIIFPGYASLWELSRAKEMLVKSECGGAWQSYVLRSHWRMVFPFSRAHQARQAEQLCAALRQGASPIVHIVRFPKLTINHGLVLFDVKETINEIRLEAYDPNDAEQPTHLLFNRATNTFSLPANRYWAGGPLDAVEIFRSWLM